jgi:predicted RNase H-like HicB family nuclease
MKTLSAKTVKLTIGRNWETPYLHILLTREDDLVVARCLDFTVSSHGQNEKQAIEAIAEAIGEYIQSAIENDSIGQIYDPAYGKYWRMFNEEVAKDTGKQLAKSLRKSVRTFKEENFRDFGIKISYA